jgi:hypothetical protein
MTFESMFSYGSTMRIALGVIFALFILCFVVIFVEETFLGGRRRRKAEKMARERSMANPPTAAPALQNSDTPHRQ